MKIFVSYASEYHKEADAISIALRQEHNTVFFDRDALPGGDAYHARIRAAINDAHLFIFLIAPESVQNSSYAMTELALARVRWPNPAGHILPVIVKTTPIDDIPEYLKAVTFVEQEGNLVADIVARVARLAKARRRRLVSIAGGVALMVTLAVVWWLNKAPPVQPPCYLWVSVVDRTGGAPVSSGLSLDVSYLDSFQSFSVPDDGNAPVHVGPLTRSNNSWTITVRSNDGSVIGVREIAGCPTSATDFSLGETLELMVKPRPQ